MNTSTKRPLLLDLFCGAGGAAKGYHDAGFEVVGVDTKPQPHYPFEFHQADAMTYPLGGFDVIHASPPCQRFSVAQALNAHKGMAPLEQRYLDLVTPMRKKLVSWGGKYVIENVPGAPLHDPIILCGSMFGLRLDHPPDGKVFHQGGYLRRHRLFEVNWPLQAPVPCRHEGRAFGVFGHGASGKRTSGRGTGGIALHANDAREIMQIDWMNRDEVEQAIPPAFTECVGRQLMKVLR